MSCFRNVSRRPATSGVVTRRTVPDPELARPGVVGRGRKAKFSRERIRFADPPHPSTEQRSVQHPECAPLRVRLL